MSESKKVGIAYVPVLHKGYLNYFETLQSEGVAELYIVSDEILESHIELDYINRKDRIRAVSESIMITALRDIVSFPVEILDSTAISNIQQQKLKIVTPKEDIGIFIVETYFKDHEVTFSDVFLRRNEANVKEDKEPEAGDVIALDVFQKKVFEDILIEAEKSADWWRHVGAAIVKDGKVVVLTHNEHLPDTQLSNVFGDLRALYKKGIHINYVTSAHAEIGAIAEAAKQGIITNGAELYVSDFPCPYCARAIVKSGITKIYFLNGYYVLEGDELFKAAGIEVVKVTK